MDRLAWQQLAERWLLDAKTLLDDHRWAAAYYLAGYAVECGLKSCILVRVAGTPEVIFENRKFSESCWTHGIPELVRLAGLEGIQAADVAADAILYKNWLVASAWSEKVRYQSISHQKAKQLYAAITDAPHGVMQWIRAHW